MNSGANGLTASVWLVSAMEVGYASGTTGVPDDGDKFTYYVTGTSSNARTKRIAYLNGSATVWWLRSPNTSYGDVSLGILPTGGICNSVPSGTNGVHPALVLPSSLLVSEDGSIYTGINVYQGVSGVVRQAASLHIAISGVTHEFASGRVGVDGVVRTF